MGSVRFDEKDYLACCGSSKFSKEMAALSPFSSLDVAIIAARDIWFNKVDVTGWLEAFAAHPAIGQKPSISHSNNVSAQLSEAYVSFTYTLAVITHTRALNSGARESSQQPLQLLIELANWNSQYRQKFGFVFLICAAGRSSPEILDELKRRFSNRPIVEFEIAAQEQMKITEIRLSKLFSDKANTAAPSYQHQATAAEKAGEDRVSVLGFHLAPAASERTSSAPTQTRPPVTTHVLDIGQGRPAYGINVRLEIWKGQQPCPSFADAGPGSWVLLGSGTTDKDGRSGQLMSTVDAASPGVYRISFDTGRYCPDGFFPFVSIVFEIKESQKFEHFHVPLLLSPFSFSTYRGS
ncbi:Uric acid degradation bifunctional protein TTL-like protein [Drosera capensis]